MEHFISLDIVTLDKTLFKGKVKKISATTEVGEITVLPNHTPLIASLHPGELRLQLFDTTNSSDMEYIAISGGFIEIRPKSVVNIIADSALRVDEIDEKKALEIKEKTEKLLKEYRDQKFKISEQEFSGAMAELSKALNQLKVVKRRRK